MRCPSCGYVSFDHLEVCKTCGADLQEERRRRGILAFNPAPMSSTSLPALPSAPSTAGVPEEHLRAIDAIVASAADPDVRASMTDQEGAAVRPTFGARTQLLDATDPVSGREVASAGARAGAFGPALADAFPKAGLWIRMAAWIADVLCLFLMTIVLAFVVLTTIWFGGRLGGQINDQVKIFAGVSSALIVTLTGFAYFTLFVGSRGQTPGKTLFGLKIVRVNGEEIGYGRACLRSLFWIVSLLLFSLGFLMIAFTRQKQGLHDMLAGSYVIRLRRPL